MKEYNKNDVVYIAIGEKKLHQVTVYDKFVDDDGQTQYIVRSIVPGIGEWNYDIRNYWTISESENGPLNFYTKERMDEIRKLFVVK